MKFYRLFLLAVLITLAIYESLSAQTPLLEFRCNMSVQIKRGTFNPATDSVWVRGNFNDWAGKSTTLIDPDGDSIYSRVFYDKFSVGQSLVFKYVHSPDVWEATGNRTLTVASGANLTSAYWEDVAVYKPSKIVKVAFSVNMELERYSGLFNPASNTVSVRGSFNGWGETLMTQSTINEDLYEVVADVIASVDDTVSFKFFYSPGTWEINNLTDNTHNDRYFVVSQNTFDSASFSYSADFNNESIIVPPNQPVTFTFTCNTNGATIKNAPAGTEFKTIHIAGGNSPLQWPGSGWPDQDIIKVIQLYDDGTHNDVVAGDKIFTITFQFPLYSMLSAKYRYSANWGTPLNGGSNDNEDVGGLNNTLIWDTRTAEAVVKDTFGIVHTTVVTQTDKTDNSIPTTFKLEQNFPNPFNPETQISWQLAVGRFVTLKIYDVLGNEVATLVNEEQQAGSYQVSFNKQLSTNYQQLTSGVSTKGGYASGVYFYQLRAGDFVQTKKMILLR